MSDVEQRRPKYWWTRRAIIGSLLVAGGVEAASWGLRHYITSRTLRHNPNPSSLTADQLRQLALGALFGEMEKTYIDSLDTGYSQAGAAASISGFLNVTDSQSAHDIISGIIQHGDRGEFNIVAAAGVAGNAQLLDQNFTDQASWTRADGEYMNLSFTKSMLTTAGVLTTPADIKRLGFAGWDAGHAAYFTRISYDAGFFDAATAWQMLAAAEVLAQQNFTNWTDFGHSFLLGCAV
jgi:hypothetical protein